MASEMVWNTTFYSSFTYKKVINVSNGENTTSGRVFFQEAQRWRETYCFCIVHPHWQCKFCFSCHLTFFELRGRKKYLAVPVWQLLEHRPGLLCRPFFGLLCSLPLDFRVLPTVNNPPVEKKKSYLTIIIFSNIKVTQAIKMEKTLVHKTVVPSGLVNCVPSRPHRYIQNGSLSRRESRHISGNKPQLAGN